MFNPACAFELSVFFSYSEINKLLSYSETGKTSATDIFVSGFVLLYFFAYKFALYSATLI